MKTLHPKSLRLAMMIAAVLCIVRFQGCTTLSLLDTRATDLRLLQRGPQPASQDVVIVAVDDESIAEIGRWPWSRATMARLVETISSGEPSVIGFDIVQSESSTSLVLDGLQQRVDGVEEQTWERVRGALESWSHEDRLLADAVRDSGRVILGYFFDFGANPTGSSSLEVSTFGLVRESEEGTGEIVLPTAQRAVGNLAALNDAALGSGYFNTFPDPKDGLYRRVPIVVRYGDSFAIPLALAMVQAHLHTTTAAIRFAAFGAEEVKLGARTIPVAEDGQMLLNFRGPQKQFQHIAAADLLKGRVDAAILRDKLVLVGVTAVAVADIRPIPFDGTYPGVEIHATAMDNMLRGEFLRQPKWTVLVEIFAVLAVAFGLGISLRHMRGGVAALIAGLYAVGYLVVTQWIFINSGLPLGIVFPLLAIFIIYGALSVSHFAAERGEKRQIREAFGLYLSPELATMVSERPELLKLGGEKREITVLFSDIRSFTSIAEALEPEALVEILNEYLGEMTDIVFKHEGTLDKYIGDAIMALWGAPIERDNHARAACLASVDMISRLATMREQSRERGQTGLEIGIGLHTGEMVVGNMGSARRLSYTAIGDNVNIGARLEGLNKMYGTQVIASESTLAAAGDVVVAREIDLVRVKGKEHPVRIFELLGRREEEATFAGRVELFERALGAYRRRAWRDCSSLLERLLARYPDDGPARLYLERAAQFRLADPAPDWDAVTAMDVK